MLDFQQECTRVASGSKGNDHVPVISETLKFAALTLGWRMEAYAGQPAGGSQAVVLPMMARSSRATRIACSEFGPGGVLPAPSCVPGTQGVLEIPDIYIRSVGGVVLKVQTRPD
jgi:hypothetical protein